MIVKRLVALYIDLAFASLVSNILSVLFPVEPYIYSDIINTIRFLVPINAILFVIVCKDILFKNRSIGKRIMGLYIYDENGEYVSDKKVLVGRIASLISIYFVNDFLGVMHGKKTRGDKKYHTYVGEKKKE